VAERERALQQHCGTQETAGSSFTGHSLHCGGADLIKLLFVPKEMQLAYRVEQTGSPALAPAREPSASVINDYVRPPNLNSYLTPACSGLLRPPLTSSRPPRKTATPSLIRLPQRRLSSRSELALEIILINKTHRCRKNKHVKGCASGGTRRAGAVGRAGSGVGQAGGRPGRSRAAPALGGEPSLRSRGSPPPVCTPE